MTQLVSFSGGKDSTAMLHMMADRGEEFTPVFFDTGWEFPAMYDHIAKVERQLGRPIVRLKPPKPFSYWMLHQPVVARKGPHKGEQTRTGNGWPSPLRRWCTREKTDTIRRYGNRIGATVHCLGIAADESHRAKPNTSSKRLPYNRRFPLIEWGMTESACLAYCKRLGYDWSGLYDIFPRVSCFCCPLQRIGALRNLSRHYPDLWATMLDWDSRMVPNCGFRDYATVRDLDARFAREDARDDAQGCLFPSTVEATA